MLQGLPAVFALLVLLPGFISARIVRMMSARVQQSELDRVIEALIFSFLTYVCYFALFRATLPLEWSVTPGTQHPDLVVHRLKLLTLVVISLCLGFAWGFVKGRDLLLKLLRRCGLTERSSRESVWSDVFMTSSGTVQVGLEDGRSVTGWLKQYSEAGDERTVFLEHAAWVSEDGTLTELPGEGRILLTEVAQIKFVMFLDEGR